MVMSDMKRLNLNFICNGAGLPSGLRFMAVLLFLVSSTVCFAGGVTLDQILREPYPPRLINDFSGVFTPDQIGALERRVVAFDDSTSNQVAVAVVPELFGYDKAELAYRIGESWKVGSSEFDNGVVILIKPKNAGSSGEVFIATGYGLEGAIPDATCGIIARQNMIPHLVENDYYGAVNEALDVIFKLASGEISAKDISDDDGSNLLVTLFFLFIIFFFVVSVVTIINDKNGPKNMGGGRGKHNPSSIDLLFLSLLAGSGSRHSSGSGGFGGGFGGFGGGSFGGGGAGASW